MLQPDRKVRVFISSRCGKSAPEYTAIRRELKKVLEQTKLFEVWIFEDAGASTCSAEQQYKFNLREADICVFIITNGEDIPNGVLKEVEEVKRYNIKSMYYFNTEKSKEETPLQKNLTGGGMPRYKEIASLEDMIGVGAKDVINDIVTIYNQYCRGYLVFPENTDESAEAKLDSSDFTVTAAVDKGILGNIDKCMNVLHQFIFNRGIEVKNTSELDLQCSRFLSTMLNETPDSAFDKSAFLSLLSGFHDKSYYRVIEARWRAVLAYFAGNIDECISALNEALELAETANLPEWIISDVLIDLRNQTTVLNETKNIIMLDSPTQVKLNKNSTLVNYPILDRFDSNEYSSYSDAALKDKTRSPYSITYGVTFNSHVSNIAGAFVVAMVNGSITQLTRLYKRLEHFSFYLCEKYSDYFLRIALIKLAVYNRSPKEVDGLIRSYDSIYRKMDYECAKEIYDFSKQWPVPHRKFMYTLQAFGTIGYYLSDNEYREVWSEVSEKIHMWLNADNRCLTAGDYILYSLEKNHLRLNNTEVANICCSFLEKKLHRFADRVFDLIGSNLELKCIEVDTLNKLIGLISTLIQNEEYDKNSRSLKNALLEILRSDRDDTMSLKVVLNEHMTEFMESDFLLYTKNGSDSFILQKAKDTVASISKINEIQGVNGAYSFGGSPYRLFGELVRVRKNSLDLDVLQSAFHASCQSLMLDRLPAENKYDAVLLLLSLIKYCPELPEIEAPVISEMSLNKSRVQTAHDVFSPSRMLPMSLAALLLFERLGENSFMEIVACLPTANDELSMQISASEIVFYFLDSLDGVLTDGRLEAVLLHQVVSWCESPDSSARQWAVLSLFLFSENPDNRSIVENRLMKTMDNDTMHIKDIVLHKIKESGIISPETKKYVVARSGFDSNYVIRQTSRLDEQEGAATK
ncbi:MAG: DUF4062 domain-containing protein [Coriobacteriales bacterium]|jgi:hypothetical protein|nr:DUF4062 domain-containing protein [Coriobacteriales bacterium]